MRVSVGLSVVWFIGAVVGCSAPVDDAGVSQDAIVQVPGTAVVRDQQETGNCWLYATTAWVESLEHAALGVKKRSSNVKAPPPLSVSYFDYWDWYAKITQGTITATEEKALREDQLDGGGSWGSAVEIIAVRGVARAADFTGVGLKRDADTTNAALTAMSASLLTGALKSEEARKDGALVRRELDRAFKLSTEMIGALTATFGADGAKKFDDGTAKGGQLVIAPDAMEAAIPRLDGVSTVRPLIDAIGEREPGDDADKRSGEFAWEVVPFDQKGNAAATRAYFKRIQRAIHAGAPVPISWFLADNGDPDSTGAYKSIPAEPAGETDSVEHETLVTDYEATDVPGFGTLKAGTATTPAQRTAALDDRAKIVFFRVKDSYGTRIVKNKRVSTNDLYVDYLTGTVRVCPDGEPKASPKCHDTIPLIDVTLPAGF